MGYMFDKEYSVTWNQERMFLAESGIRYCFYKEVVDEKTGKRIDVWKYKKTKELFKALSEFYD